MLATYGANIQENESFLYFSNHFYKKQLPVPEIYFISEDRLIYLQQDFGDVSLSSQLEKEGNTLTLYSLFKESLQNLASLQVKGNAGLDYKKCITNAN